MEWAAGDTVVFGSYEQDNDLTNGQEPLEWIVLKTEERPCDADYAIPD